jgi:hypothetical protein
MNSHWPRKAVLTVPLLVLSTLATACGGTSGSQPARGTDPVTPGAAGSAAAPASSSGTASPARADQALTRLAAQFQAQLYQRAAATRAA